MHVTNVGKQVISEEIASMIGINLLMVGKNKKVYMTPMIL